MSLSDLQTRILHPFVEETVLSLKTMAHMGSKGGDGFQDEVSSFRFKGYAIATQVSGPLSGVVLLHLYPETALAIGNRVVGSMLGVASDEPALTPELEEALAEWGNTLIGRATRELEEAHFGIKFTPPFFVRDTEHMGQLMAGVNEIVSIPVHTDDAGRFYFNYLLHAKTVNV
jgi:CheY-specific phosphatase CheX